MKKEQADVSLITFEVVKYVYRIIALVLLVFKQIKKRIEVKQSNASNVDMVRTIIDNQTGVYFVSTPKQTEFNSSSFLSLSLENVQNECNFQSPFLFKPLSG